MSALTLDGVRLVFGGASALISDAVQHAGTPLGLAHAGSLASGAGLMVPAAWLALLNGDTALVTALADADPKGTAAGKAILEAMRRAAEPDRTPAELRDAAEAAALTVTAHLQGKRVADRLRADLARPVAVTLHAWTPAGLADALTLAASPAEVRTNLEAACPHKRGKKRDTWIADHLRNMTDPRAAVRLTGGPFGHGLVLSPKGTSRLEWTALVWQAALAAYTKTPAQTGRAKSSPGAEAVVILRDGVPVAAGDLDHKSIAEVLADLDGQTPLDGGDAGFVEQKTRERDEGQRLPGEERHLEEISEDEYLPDMSTEDERFARRLAKEALLGKSWDARLRGARAEVAEAYKGRRLSDLDCRLEWARALARIGRQDAEKYADATEVLILDAVERDLPGPLGALLMPGAPEPADPWQLAVARRATEIELDKLAERVERPNSQARIAALRTRALPPRPDLIHTVHSLAVGERDRQSGLRVVDLPVQTEVAARVAIVDLWRPEGVPRLGPGESAVLLSDVSYDRVGLSRKVWRVVIGTLPVLLAAKITDLRLKRGVPEGRILDSDTGDLLPECLAWAVARWTEAGCNGEPPPLADAVATFIAATH